MDIVDPETRSRMMSGIRGRNTAPELLVRRYLHAAGLRFRLHARNLPGSPDIVFPSRRAAVFVHGCFWHQHPGCRYARQPATRREFWSAKFDANRQRDSAAMQGLAAMGWSTEVVWECQVADELILDSLVWRLLALPGH